MDEILEVLDDINDEDFEILLPRTRGPTKIRDRIDHFEKWDEMEFFERFRMHKRTANVVLEIIQDSISSRTMKNRAIPPSLKFLTTLRYYATGSFLMNVGEMCGIHYSTASKVVKQVSVSIARMCPQYISMPTEREDVRKVKCGFYEKARFPNCIGAVDCTHIKIQSPGGCNAELYRNRKGTFSINTQVICDASLRIRNIVARWPGSTHDSHIFHSSRVRHDFEIGIYGKNVLVGDSGYSCTNYLITPLDEVETEAERLFQESQVRTRNPIERCLGVWKRRFPVLSIGIKLNIDRAESIIVATSVLHNICVNEQEDVPPIGVEVEEAIANLEMVRFDILPNGPQNRVQRRVQDLNMVTRNNLIEQYFTGLL
jgi:hypothetical protein